MENKESKSEPFVVDLLSVGFKEVSTNVFRRKAKVWKLHYQVRWYEYIATGDNSCGWIFEYYWEEDTVSSAKTQSIPCGFIRDIDHLNQICVALHNDQLLPYKPVDIVKPDFEKQEPKRWPTIESESALQRAMEFHKPLSINGKSEFALAWRLSHEFTNKEFVLPLIKERDEMKAELIKCEKSFGLIDTIFTSLKSAGRSDLSDLVNEIDIDLPLIQAKIKDTIRNHEE